MNNEINWRSIGKTSIALFAILSIFILSVKISNLQTLQTVKTETVFDLNDPFTVEKAKNYLIQLHVRYPDVAIAQMKLESASGTSNIFREGNNLWGMKLPTVRPSTALGERNGHAYYSHWRQSCIDFALFMAYNMNEENSKTEETWINYISKYYSEDNSYKVKLLRIKNAGTGR